LGSSCCQVDCQGCEWKKHPFDAIHGGNEVLVLFEEPHELVGLETDIAVDKHPARRQGVLPEFGYQSGTGTRGNAALTPPAAASVRRTMAVQAEVLIVLACIPAAVKFVHVSSNFPSSRLKLDDVVEFVSDADAVEPLVPPLVDCKSWSSCANESFALVKSFDKSASLSALKSLDTAPEMLVLLDVDAVEAVLSEAPASAGGGGGGP